LHINFPDHKDTQLCRALFEEGGDRYRLHQNHFPPFETGPLSHRETHIYLDAQNLKVHLATLVRAHLKDLA
jgi:hypothetical protein